MLEKKGRICPFFGLFAGESKEELTERLLEWKRRGVSSVTIEYAERNKEGEGFGKESSGALKQLAEVCRELSMSFWIQDAAPFPTGNANGALEKEENKALRKQYLGERHMDVTGPKKGAGIPVQSVLHSVGMTEIFGEAGKRMAQNMADRRLLEVAAYEFSYEGKIKEASQIVLWKKPTDFILGYSRRLLEDFLCLCDFFWGRKGILCESAGSGLCNATDFFRTRTYL